MCGFGCLCVFFCYEDDPQTGLAFCARVLFPDFQGFNLHYSTVAGFTLCLGSFFFFGIDSIPEKSANKVVFCLLTQEVELRPLTVKAQKYHVHTHENKRLAA